MAVKFDSWVIGNATYTSKSGDVSGEVGTSIGGVLYKPDGTKMFVSGEGTDGIHGYDLSTKYDPSSLSIDNSDTTTLSIPKSLGYSDNGSSLYYSNADTLYQVELSTSWDLSSVSNESKQDITSQVTGTEGQGIAVKNDGTKLMVLDSDGTLYEYDMTTDHDVTSVSYTNNSFSISKSSSVDGLFFRPDGSKFYVVDGGNDRILSYSTASDWSLSSTPSFKNEFDVSGEDTTPKGIGFGTDGDNFIVGGDQNSNVYQYQVEELAEDTSTSYETFPDVPYIIDRDRRSGQVTSEASNEFQDFRQLNHRPYHAYTLDMSVLSPSDQDKIQDLSITHSGYGGSSGNVRFLFKDPDDNSVSDVQFGTGDGSTTKFQLKNKYTFGSQSIKYPQGHIDEGTETIKNDGSTVSDSDISITYDSGTVEFVNAPADGNALTASFEFYRLCQFRNPEVSVSIETASRRNQTIEIVEVAGA